MGLIGFHLVICSPTRERAPDAHGAVRAPPAAVAAIRLEAARDTSCARRISATGTTSRCWATARPEGPRSRRRAAHLQWRRADLGRAVRGIPRDRLAPAGPEAQCDVTRSTASPKPRWPSAFPPRRGAAGRTLNRHHLGVGAPRRPGPMSRRDALALPSVGRRFPHCELTHRRTTTMPHLAAGRVGHIPDPRRQCHRRLLRGTRRSTPRASPRRLAAHRRSGLLIHAGELYITGRAKEILFVNGQNYYPHDLEAFASRHAGGMELGKVVVAGVRPPAPKPISSPVFVLHRGEPAGFPALATRSPASSTSRSAWKWRR